MKKILLASVALFGFAGVASAADLPARTAAPLPVIAAAPIFTWTGFYAGVNAGYGWHNDDNETAVFVPGGAVGVGSVPGTIGFGNDNGDGFVGGGQIGYNYQIGSFVVGLETDIQFADLGGEDGNASFPAQWAAYDFRPAGVANGLDWFGTVRAKAGVAFGQALVYATGGFAYGGADDSNDDFFSSNDDVRTGWALGAGFEYAFTNNLTAGIEGLWVNLDGDNNGTFIGSSVPSGVVGGERRAVEVAGADRDNDADFFVARAKLNFKFGTY
jgi:outer membrane immunogenic protein